MSVAAVPDPSSAAVIQLVQRDYFDLFGLPRQYVIDATALEQAYHQLQLLVHPDKYAARPANERKAAMQAAAHVNTAVRVLRYPLSRAQYLCELNGVDVQLNNNRSTSSEFLMQQMQWRENLADAQSSGDLATLDSLEKQAEQYVRTLQETLLSTDWHEVARAVQQWMFVDKFLNELHTAQESF